MGMPVGSRHTNAASQQQQPKKVEYNNQYESDGCCALLFIVHATLSECEVLYSPSVVWLLFRNVICCSYRARLSSTVADSSLPLVASNLFVSFQKQESIHLLKRIENFPHERITIPYYTRLKENIVWIFLCCYSVCCVLFVCFFSFILFFWFYSLNEMTGFIKNTEIINI